MTDDLLNLMTTLGVIISDKMVKLRGRQICPESIERVMRDLWGRDYHRHPQYRDPTKCCQDILDLVEADRAQRKAAATASGQYFNSTREWVEHWFNRLCIHITDSGVWSAVFNGERVDYSVGSFLNFLKSILTEYNHSGLKEAGFPIIKSEFVAPTLQTFLLDRETKRIETLRALLAHRPVDYSPEDFVAGLLEVYYIEPTPENIAAFLHMIWMLKRKIWMLPIPEPLFFCIHSTRQHMGKTTMLRKLCTGFEWVHSDRGILANLLDVNAYKAMIRGKYLIDFQELALGAIKSKGGGVDEATVVALKSIITSDTISGREMYMSANGIERQTAVFCSSTNKNIWDVVSDPSGMRRYWQFNMKPPEKIDPEFYLNANIYFDNILDIYHAIDENNPCGYFHPSLPIWQSMRHTQEGYAKENTFLAWAHQMGWQFHATEQPGAIEMEVKRLVEKFNNYLRERGDPTWNARYVIWAIASNRDLLPMTKTINGKVKETYWVSGVKA